MAYSQDGIRIKNKTLHKTLLSTIKKNAVFIIACNVVNYIGFHERNSNRVYKKVILILLIIILIFFLLSMYNVNNIYLQNKKKYENTTHFFNLRVFT